MFRVTPQQLANNTVRYSRAHLSNLERLQTELSTGLRIHKPSDSPGEIGPLLANRASVARIDIDLSNMEVSRSKLNQSVAQLLSAQDALTRANSLALEGVQANDDDRATLAREVNGILELLIRIGNSTDGGNPVYAGTSNDLDPFVVSDYNENGQPDGITYRGTRERSRILVGVLTTTDALYTGEEIFMGHERSETIYLGATGVRAGIGTDTDTGFGEIVVRHTGTTIQGASGLQLGDSSSDDTLIGDHVLTIDSVENTLRLDGGNPHGFVPGDTDVVVVASDGARISVDTSALAPGFSGDITVHGDGTVSLDGGTTEVVIDFTENQSLVHPASGEVTNIDSRSISQAGTDQIEYSGTSGIFQALMDLRDELLNSRRLPPGEWTDAMDRRLGDIQRVHDHLLDIVAEQSVDLENLDGLQRRAEDFQLETQIVVASVESADITDAIVKMQTEQNALQYTYAVTSQILDTSLLDFLR